MKKAVAHEQEMYGLRALRGRVRERESATWVGRQGREKGERTRGYQECVASSG